jgi:hypothetical protein
MQDHASQVMGGMLFQTKHQEVRKEDKQAEEPPKPDQVVEGSS